MELLFLILAAFFALFLTVIAFIRRYRRCPSDKILVVFGKIAGGGRGGLSAKCYHGGAAFIWPIIQDFRFLDLTPMTIDIKLEGALSLQNIRINTPSTFTVGISTEPGVMENAAERLLHMGMKEVAELARDIIFGQMRVVIATMPIEEINADRDKLIENISSGVEVELKKVGLRLINVNIQDITDESGYIDALGKEAAARAINEAKIKVAEKERDGSIGAANAERDQRIQVASAGATAVEGENEAKITIAQSNSRRREQEAEAERTATAAEKVKSAQALEEAYKAEETAERQRAKREEATQSANVVVPAEIKKREIEILAEAEAERTRRLKKGEADGLRSVMEAEAEGLKAILSRKAEGFDRIVDAARGMPELASLLLVTEQLPKLVEEQVKAISNLKIDSVTVWEGGRGKDGRTATADFVSGLVGALPPLHELTRNVGVRLPEYLGRSVPGGGDEGPEGGSGGSGGAGGGGGSTPPGAAPAGGAGRGSGGGGARAAGRPAASAQRASAQAESAQAAPVSVAESGEPGGQEPAKEPARQPEEESAAAAAAAAEVAEDRAPAPSEEPSPAKPEASEIPAEIQAGAETSQEELATTLEALHEKGRAALRSWLEEHPGWLRLVDKNRDQHLDEAELDQLIATAARWAQRTRDLTSSWYYVEDGKPVGPRNWPFIRRLGERFPELPVALEGARSWLPFGAVAEAGEMEEPDRRKRA